jgi:hypothetical protein
MKKLLIVLLLAPFFVGCGLSNTTVSVLTETSAVSEFEGKPSAIVFGGTYCPHCTKAVPLFKTQIWDNYSEKANLWVNVIDKKKFDVEDVAQGFNENLTFEGVAKKPCGFVPAWVVLDENFELVSSSCGGEKTLDDMQKALDDLLE